MGAMEINKSGTTATDGLSGGVDGGDPVEVRIRLGRGKTQSRSGTKHSENAGQCRHGCVDLPRGDALNGESEHHSQMSVTGQPELLQQLLLGDGRKSDRWPEDLRAQIVPGHPGYALDRDRHCCGDPASRTPITDGALPNTKMDCEGGDSPGGFHGSVECVHSGSITYRDPWRNTNRVGALSQSVKNWPMAFSDNLRAARLRSGLTQEALALACGWSGQSRIANYESSAPTAREPKVSEVPLLAKALGVSIASLFGEAPASQSQRPDPAILAQTHQFLDRAFGTLGKVFNIEAEADLFADVYEWIVSDDRAADQRNLVDFAAWREKRDLNRGTGADEQNGSPTKQAGRAHKRSA